MREKAAGHADAEVPEGILREGLRRFILEEVLFGDLVALHDEEPLLSTGLIDSFHLLRLAAHIEGAYGVRLPDEDLSPECFDTLDGLVEYVRLRVR